MHTCIRCLCYSRGSVFKCTQIRCIFFKLFLKRGSTHTEKISTTITIINFLRKGDGMHTCYFAAETTRIHWNSHPFTDPKKCWISPLVLQSGLETSSFSRWSNKVYCCRRNQKDRPCQYSTMYFLPGRTHSASWCLWKSVYGLYCHS